MFLVSSDNPFHKIGAATKKALLPYLLRLKFGTVKRPLFVNLKSLLGRYGIKISHRYLGAVPVSALKVSTRIMKSFLSWTGSQWSSFSVGVTCSYFQVHIVPEPTARSAVLGVSPRRGY